MIQSLEEEVSILAMLQHPHITHIYGVCICSQTEIWIVMEFADGGNLYELLLAMGRGEKKIEWTERWRFAHEAATAVGYLHREKILHRDLKSPNLLLAQGRIKIADFGMSTAVKIASIGVFGSSSKGKSKIMGSVRWLAPETTATKPVFSEKSDIFSLGMVLWEIASGEIPFLDVPEDGQVIYLIKHEKARPDIPKNCPDVYAEIIAKCWENSPDDRPTAIELLAIIEASMPMELPLQPPPPPPPSPPLPPPPPPSSPPLPPPPFLISEQPTTRSKNLTLPPLPPSSLSLV
jgi:mitogen-activated protein kinase kinase kinase 13